MYLRYFLLWLPMIALAFANAALRQFVFLKYFSELSAHQLSTITLMILCTVYVGFVYSFLHIQNSGQALLPGLIWATLTIVFEFSMGFFARRTLPDLLMDYNIMAGRIWPLFLIWLFVLPYLFYKLRH